MESKFIYGNINRGRLQAFGSDGKRHCAGLLSTLHNGRGRSREQVHFGKVKESQTGGVAVGSGAELSGAADRELHFTLIGRHKIAILVGHLDGDVGKVLAVGR